MSRDERKIRLATITEARQRISLLAKCSIRWDCKYGEEKDHVVYSEVIRELDNMTKKATP